jgi:luciferase family oxidoreductase group 1
MDIPALSGLEIALVEAGRSSSEGLAAATALTRRAEELGFRRMWVAEHHAANAVAAISPPVLATYLAGQTSTLRVGSGGVLVPNHAPLVVAEQFATMAALYPGRIDLGLGRGPGARGDNLIRALRRGGEPTTDAEYRADLVELLDYLAGKPGVDLLPQPESLVTPEPWLLSSSAAGCDLAAELGLPIAFAHHIRPDNTVDAIARYRDEFQPSRWRAEPYVIVCVETLCAETDTEAARIHRPFDVLKMGAFDENWENVGVPTPEDSTLLDFGPKAEEMLGQHKAAQAIGSPETVIAQLADITAATAADELMLATVVYDVDARIRSFELVAQAAAAHNAG